MSESQSLAKAKAFDRYAIEQIVLHWILAVAIAVLFLFGIYMTALPLSPQKLRYVNWHKWAGICVLLASLVRAAVRAARGAPRPVAMPMWQARAARAAHFILYLLTIAVPLIGWAYTSAAGFPVVLFGHVALPDLVPVDRHAAETLKALHAWVAWALIAMAGLHAAAGVKHHFVDRNPVLRRMWPGSSPKQEKE
jgi:cytochrome b561